MNKVIELGKMKITLSADQIRATKNGLILSDSRVTLGLPLHPVRFYRHSWQSWSVTTWLDPSISPIATRLSGYLPQEDDPKYAKSERHGGAGLGAVEVSDGNILLLGALGLDAHVELEGQTLHGFYETAGRNDISSYPWFAGYGQEEQVFARYAELLGERFERGRAEKAPRVWCSWYSLYWFIHEKLLHQIIDGLGDLPFDVIQIDDGWQQAVGDWEANNKFPSGMAALAERIRKTGRRAGLWLAPLMVVPESKLIRDHPDWLLRDERDNPVIAGKYGASSPIHAIDTTHPAVQEWLAALIRKARGWGYDYFKLDFLYAGAMPGKRYKGIPREIALREGLKIMREAAGDAFILTCGVPVLPALGLCDAMRVGTDVTPYWVNKGTAVYLNNPNAPSTQNAIRTSLHRLWLKPLLHPDPDVVYFRSRHNALKPHEKSLLRDLAWICGFKGTSDLPKWMTRADRAALREFLETEPRVERLSRYRFRIDGREVNFEPFIALPQSSKVPYWLASNLGLAQSVTKEVLPAILTARTTKMFG